MTGKRLKLASLILRTGIHRPWLGSSAASLLVVNYHRLWPSRSAGPSRFDDGVFGPDAEVFRRQMEWLRKSTRVLDEAGLIELVGKADHPKGIVYSAVTFDDAYVDCDTLARPILDELGIKGFFFVPVDMVDSRHLGWWDLAAYLLKSSKHGIVHVRGDSLDLHRSFSAALRRVLNMFKLEPADRTDGLLDELSFACGVALPDKGVQSAELMSWEQIREMSAAGHAIGSHTFSHRVLATLSDVDQAREIKDSRRELAGRLGKAVRSFAYPVGGPQHINGASTSLVGEAGYDLAFTFNTGIESLPIANRFRIARESARTLDQLQAKVLMPSLMGIRRKQLT